MAFATGHLDEMQQIGSGEIFSRPGVILTFTSFEDGLKAGRFAKLDTGRLDNLDGAATPVIAGVVRRLVTNAVEHGGVYKTALHKQVEVVYEGLTTVDVKEGETPSMFARVFISNDGDASDGLATADNTDVPANAAFLYEVKPGVWAIYVTPPGGDVAAHIANNTNAHAAVGITVADSGNRLTSTNVEAALAEIVDAYTAYAPFVPAATGVIADPGDTEAIPVDRSGIVVLETAGAETRTLADPETAGVRLGLALSVDGGDCVISAATAINQTGNNTVTLNDAGDYVELVAVDVGGSLVWRVAANDGATLTTVE